MSSQLLQLQKALHSRYPKLQTVEKSKVINEDELFADNFVLVCTDGDRNCTISIQEAYYRCILKWDDCPVGETSNVDENRLGALLVAWIVEKTNPSTLQTQYPEINFNHTLTSYYELGEGIKGEFINSWNEIEAYYNEFIDEKEDALRLIKEMRSLGLDEKLRAGQSLWFFILSRTRRYGLGLHTPYVQINFLGHKKINVRTYFDGIETKFETEARYQGKLQEVIERLVKKYLDFRSMG
jgi:hypothetical protein